MFLQTNLYRYYPNTHPTLQYFIKLLYYNSSKLIVFKNLIGVLVFENLFYLILSQLCAASIIDHIINHYYKLFIHKFFLLFKKFHKNYIFFY